MRQSFPPRTAVLAFVLGGLAVAGPVGCAARRGATTSAAPTSATGAPVSVAGVAVPLAGGALGVPPFTVSDAAADSALAPLAFALADLLTTDLSRSRQVTLVERARLGEVLRELDLVAGGRVDSATAPRLGRLVQARRLVVGQVAALARGRDIRLGVRLADVQSGAVENAIDASAPLANVLAAEKALAFRLFDQLGVTLTPDERAAVAQRPTENLAALLAYGNGMRRQFLGDYWGAAAEFRRAAQIDPAFALARQRAAAARNLAESGSPSPVLVPGVRAIDAAVGVTIDRLNRPIDVITSLTSGGARVSDPTFPSTSATVVITVTRP